MNLLKCNICGSNLIVLSKQGRIIHTSCPNCGIDNSSMITARINKEAESHTCEIIRLPVRKTGGYSVRF